MGSNGKQGNNICLFINPSRIRRWHVWLAQALREAGDKVVIAHPSHMIKGNISSEMFLGLERRIYRLPGEQAFDLIAANELDIRSPSDCREEQPFDILINFTSQGLADVGATRVLTPRFDGISGDLGAYAALLERRNVLIHVEDSTQADHCWIARPASEDKQVVGRGLNNVFSRSAEILLYAIQRQGTASSLVPLSDCGAHKQAPNGLSLALSSASQISRGLAKKIVRRLTRGAEADEHWAIGWRFVEGPGLLDEGEGATATYNIIPDDAKRYFADPFVYQKDGQTYIFCEEYPYDTEKGVISVFTLGDDGNLSEPRRVLERPYHLSYPHLIERDGEIWMIPEAGAGGNVELYRATCFPDKWELEKVLIEGVAGYDATLTEHDGKFWLFMTTSCWQSTSWDNLELYSADSLQGEWTAHSENPILVDGYVSRPGGEMISQEGALLRPAQNGGEMYGGGLAICRVDHLDERNFAQTVVGNIRVTSPKTAYGVHTINRVANIEVIDILGKMSPEEEETSVLYESTA